MSLKVCLGVRCCKCKCRCTAIHKAHLWVLLPLGVSQNKEGYNATVFNGYDSLLQYFLSLILYYHKLYINKHLSV